MTEKTLTTPISLSDIQEARARLQHCVVNTPLIKLNAPESDNEIYLKLEIIQPIGSFKLRGAGNAILSAPVEQLADGIVTASAGNMAQGVAWHARKLALPCHVIVPEHASMSKLNAVHDLGGVVKQVPFKDWWKVMQSSQCELPGLFVHPVSDRQVITGNATLGLEILEQLPDVDAIFAPFGGGGLACGIASAMAASGRDDVEITGCELETATPLGAALASNSPTEVTYRPSFVDGIGSTGVLNSMWPLVQRLIDTSTSSTLEEVAAAIRALATRHHIIAEGAGATAVAAAMNSDKKSGKIVCIVSGGNIDMEKLLIILGGRTP